LGGQGERELSENLERPTSIVEKRSGTPGMGQMRTLTPKYWRARPDWAMQQ